MKEFTKDDFQRCFKPLKIRMDSCSEKERVYIEMDNNYICVNLK